VISNFGIAAQFDKIPISPQIATPDAEAIVVQSEAHLRWLADSALVLIRRAGTDNPAPTPISLGWTSQCDPWTPRLEIAGGRSSPGGFGSGV
jgi:hypothetical protein